MADTLPPGATQYFKRPFNKVETLDTYLGRELGIVERAIRDRRLKLQRTVTGDLTLTEQDEIVYVDATAGAITVTLPDVRRFWGFQYNVKKIDASANVVTVASAALIDGAASAPLATQYESLTVQDEGTTWYIL